MEARRDGEDYDKVHTETIFLLLVMFSYIQKKKFHHDD
jgi:hypothetical protein